MQIKQSQDILCWHLDVEDLKDPELVSGLVQRIAIACNLSGDNTMLQLVVVELINNALDHGVLKLQSSLKARADGFTLYYQERERRLRELDAGWIEISIELVGKQKLCMRVLDSGEGFDYRAIANHTVGLSAEYDVSYKAVYEKGEVKVVQSGPPIGEPEVYGRGLPILRELCETVAHVGCGNEVVVEIDLQTLAQGTINRKRTRQVGALRV